MSNDTNHHAASAAHATAEAANTADLIQLVTQVLQASQALTATVADHIAEERPMLRAIVDSLPVQPDGTPDFAAHRAYHDAEIEERRERAKLFRALRAELLKGTMFGLIGVLLFLVGYWWSNGHVIPNH